MCIHVPLVHRVSSTFLKFYPEVLPATLNVTEVRFERHPNSLVPDNAFKKRMWVQVVIPAIVPLSQRTKTGTLHCVLMCIEIHPLIVDGARTAAELHGSLPADVNLELAALLARRHVPDSILFR